MAAANSTSRSGNIGPYFFYIEGLPPQYTWKDLKDLIRQKATHGLWTEMAIYPNGQAGGKGYARVQRKDEACELYKFLIAGNRLRVHFWDIVNPEPRLLTCNCNGASGHPAQGVQVRSIALRASWPVSNATPSLTPAPTMQAVGGAVQYTTSPAYAPITAVSPQAGLQQGFASLQISPRDSGYAASNYQRDGPAMRSQYMAIQQQSARQPAYAMSPAGTPVNTERGTVRTEARGIFVGGLDYKAKAKDVEEVFSRAGRITRFEMQKSASTGKSKGKAMIQYASTAEAQKAIEMFHDKLLRGRLLEVRLDKERTVISPPPLQASRTNEPIIVNGSQARTYAVAT